MVSSIFTRRNFPIRLASLLTVPAITVRAFGGFGKPQNSGVTSTDGISHTADTIHQEVVFKANPKRVYDALTDVKQFDKVIQLGKAGMPQGSKPTQISREAGGTFSLFGGFIVGRHIELVPGVRLVQAWRDSGWNTGIYSIVKFELISQGSGTKLAFDQTGIPPGAAEHLAIGWKENYWEPLGKFLV